MTCNTTETRVTGAQNAQAQNALPAAATPKPKPTTPRADSHNEAAAARSETTARTTTTSATPTQWGRGTPTHQKDKVRNPRLAKDRMMWVSASATLGVISAVALTFAGAFLTSGGAVWWEQ